MLKDLAIVGGDAVGNNPKQHICLELGGATILFLGGVVTDASFSGTKHFGLLHGKDKFALPMSQRELERVFGKPLSIRCYSFWG